MSAVSDAIVEIDAQLVALAKPHEGWRDFYKLNLKPDAGRYAGDRIVVYDRREALLNQARAALVALDADGHPGIAPAPTTAEIYADLRDNDATINAAFSETPAPPAVVTLGLSAEGTEPK